MRKWIIGLLAMLTLIFAAAPAALALDQREGDRVLVAKEETIQDDMTLFGDSVVIEGTVDGDVFAFARTVTVNGTIKGNLVTAASMVEVRGNVTGTVLSAGESVYVEGRVDGSLVAAGSRVALGQAGTVGHSLLAGADRFTLDGSVGRGVAVGAGTATVSGRVGKELNAATSKLVIAAPAVVGGKVNYKGSTGVVVEPGARTGEVSQQITNDYAARQATWWFSFWWVSFKFIGFLLTGLLVLTLFPALRRAFPGVINAKPWQVPVAGFLGLVGVPVALVVLLLTVVGIPLSLIGMVLFPVLIYFGQILVSWFVGHLLAANVDAMRNWSWPLVFLVGALLTTLAIHVPFVGGAVGLGALLYGIGGVYYLVVDSRKQAAA
ncbi:MAG TPA: polymer-forming cytoskeletal protein [Symbiobacteriaceae bacterium]|jgi:cytoskeletal protein CcmA (bactofilin family)|nr:polymer-forming cytoskeletal protein [Symbiobacteriaceae bacterium]